ncbi:NUDIX hydrolase [Dongia rigui]|uniref:NUDIX hydrolase n=1 Tax=Dongia rigui TaxID=940149 RepID=A0ABU5DXF4_9PROT|nr:NUDIX hydrolase [Dongia rigui]MDY0871977.1 NUDIX hydrolase [Dongia rigui]
MPTSKDPSFAAIIPEGDNRLRQVCTDCGFVAYENPKVVVGAVVTLGEKILLCRRAINPRKGFWTLPAGFMELHESAETGAAREALEEANAKIEIEALLAAYTIPRLSQVQLIYRARLIDPAISAGVESLEVGLFDYADIPWDELAFPSVNWALTQFASVRHLSVFPAFGNPPGETGDHHP